MSEFSDTPFCAGGCQPSCAWCTAAHNCPADCGGGAECPYAGIGADPADVQLRQQGEAVATAVEARRAHSIGLCDPIRVLKVAAAVARRRATK